MALGKQKMLAFMVLASVLGTLLYFLFYIKGKKAEALESNTLRSKSWLLT